MREILFRGKRSDGKWVFGSLLKVTFDGTTYNLIFADNFLFVFGQATAMEHAAVITETVGQFTGLTDKNGKKIFEGDILKNTFFTNPSIGVVKFGGHNPNGMDCADYSIGFFVDWNDDFLRNDLLSWIEKATAEVIGNIHDNPELLEVSE